MKHLQRFKATQETNILRQELSKLLLCLNGHSVFLQLQTDDMHELRKCIDNFVFISLFAKSDINILLEGNKK